MSTSNRRSWNGVLLTAVVLAAAACSGTGTVETTATTLATSITVSTTPSSTLPPTTSPPSTSPAETTTTTIPHAAGVTVETVVADLDAGTGGLSITADGFLFSADFGYTGHRGDRVFRVSLGGEVETYFQNEELWTASGNTMGPDGLLYQSSFGNDVVLRIDDSGGFEIVADDVEGVVGVAVAEDGTLYVASCREDTIEIVTPDGAKELFAFDTTFNCPNGLILAPDGNLYMANFGNGLVHQITLDGEITEVADLPGNNNGHLAWRDGELIVAARGANQIYGVTPDGAVRLIAGSGELGLSDGPGAEAAIGLPNGVAIGPEGEIYINHSTSPDGSSNNPHAIRVIRIEE